MNNQFDVIVVGGGHAGCEAAMASARMGAKTLLLTQALDTIGQMSCNPAIGGIGKSHLVKEIDALGGIMARAADRAAIHCRVLNSAKGPAVRATRMQADRLLYKQAIRQLLDDEPNCFLFQQGVQDFIIEGDRIKGVVVQMGMRFFAHAVILTVGTFLGGQIHIGLSQYGGGRAGEANAGPLATRLRALPFHIARLKTGTPPRIDGRSIDFSALPEQKGDTPRPVFSFYSDASQHPRQISCYITQTNPTTHDIIRASLDRSPMYSGVIEGTGPRYCPSIEDKIVRFADRDQHQIFIEPEGLNTYEVYPNGISTSLPFDVQIDFVRSIAGFAKAQLTRPGYAIEYDFFDPRDLKASLETKVVDGLYFAGQINGTTGYEEAAAQGLIAGLNAARQVHGLPAWTPRRDQAYMGVLIDDLVTQGTSEPYRMFTSRAEYRLLLRQDNSDLRLTPIGRELGLVGDAQWSAFCAKKTAIEAELARLKQTWIRPGTDNAERLAKHCNIALKREYSVFDLLKRPHVNYVDIMRAVAMFDDMPPLSIIEQVSVQAKYDGYIQRQTDDIARLSTFEATPLTHDLDYSSVAGLSNEVVEKLTRIQPATLGQAARIAGVTPAAVSILAIYLKKHRASKQTIEPIDEPSG